MERKYESLLNELYLHKIDSMRNVIFIFIFLLSTSIRAQTFDSSWCYLGMPAYIDSTYDVCDSANTNFKIRIENTANNLWQYGNSLKFGVQSTQDSSCSIITDTSNYYTTNNTSAFYFILPEKPPMTFWGSNYNYYLKFWHKYDLDSLMDGCWLEFSADSGATWNRINKNGGMQGVFGVTFLCNVYNHVAPEWALDTLVSGTTAWTGSSNGWEFASVGMNIVLPIKPSRSGLINAVRFVFKSDSIQNNKHGWAIRDISIGTIDVGTNTTDHHKYQRLEIYPNPSNNGIFYIKNLGNTKGTIYIYDISGRLLQSSSLNETINLTEYKSGIYSYKCLINGNVFNGTLFKL